MDAVAIATGVIFYQPKQCIIMGEIRHYEVTMKGKSLTIIKGKSLKLWVEVPPQKNIAIHCIVWSPQHESHFNDYCARSWVIRSWAQSHQF